jgi:hypothetical protein
MRITQLYSTKDRFEDGYLQSWQGGRYLNMLEQGAWIAGNRAIRHILLICLRGSSTGRSTSPMAPETGYLMLQIFYPHPEGRLNFNGMLLHHIVPRHNIAGVLVDDCLFD